MRTTLSIFFLCALSQIIPQRLQAQEKDSVRTIAINYKGDTIPQFILHELQVNPMPTFESRRFARKYWRLVSRVKKTYPYAKLAAELMEEYSQKYDLSQVKDSERKKYIKQMEKELMNTYGDELRRMSISDGRILIKLIDRETQSTSYELIKELRGGTSAFFWQGVAKIFGNDLKSEFDPDENFEDEHIDQILLFLRYNMI
ncbi:MAG: DUF4294 domain-containing protein [Mangrovibacterium sp.]